MWDQDFGYGGSARGVRPAAAAAAVEKDFVQHVLSWPLRSLKEPLPEAVSAVELPAKRSSVTHYYDQFLPFILEEARAAMGAGLEAVHQRKVHPFDIRLTADVNLAKNPGNPSAMNFSGMIPEEYEHSSSMNVLLLTHHNGREQDMIMLALASSDAEKREIRARAMIFLGTMNHHAHVFKAGQRWQATYLTSLVTQQRMYEACLKKVKPDCLRAIVCAQIPAPPHRYNAEVTQFTANLNASQQRAVQSFLALASGVELLQGPPGTGKTTTVTALLSALFAKGTRTLVCAPSNKAVQVLAERFLRDHPELPVILVGVEGKVPEHLKPIFLHTWKKDVVKLLVDATGLLSSVADFSLKPKQQEDLGKIQGIFLTKLANARAKLESMQCQLNKYGFISRGAYPSQTDISSQQEMQGLFQVLDRLQKEIEEFDPQKPQSSRVAMTPYSSRPFGFSAFNRASLSAAAAEPAVPQSILERLKITIKAELEQLTTLLQRMQVKLSGMDNDAFELRLLNQSKIVFATLSVCGRYQMLQMNSVDALVIDEAAQGVEAEALFAFQHNPKKVLLVGDTKQLPATVISETAVTKHFDDSMMWRLIERNNQPHSMLDTQYRMHPMICQWPSNQYYEVRLVTAPHLIVLASVPALNQPLAFYDVKSNEKSQGHSYQNDIEARYAIGCIRKLHETNPGASIGVITFYAAQVSAIKAFVGHELLGAGITVSTIDGFQGDERDITIVSCVRANPKASIGFLKDFRRLNVAITRAKNTLIIIGNARTLESQDSDVKLMIADQRSRGFFYPETQLKRHLGLEVQVSQAPPKAHQSRGGAAAAAAPAPGKKHVSKKIPAAEAPKTDGRVAAAYPPVAASSAQIHHKPKQRSASAAAPRARPLQRCRQRLLHQHQPQLHRALFPSHLTTAVVPSSVNFKTNRQTDARHLV